MEILSDSQVVIQALGSYGVDSSRYGTLVWNSLDKPNQRNVLLYDKNEIAKREVFTSLMETESFRGVGRDVWKCGLRVKEDGEPCRLLSSEINCNQSKRGLVGSVLAY